MWAQMKHGEEVHLEEIELNHNIQFNKPQDRLFTGQIDPNSWFLLRYQTWQYLQQHQQSPVKGLIGCADFLNPAPALYCPRSRQPRCATHHAGG